MKTHREYSVSLLKSPLLSALGLGLGLGFRFGFGFGFGFGVASPSPNLLLQGRDRLGARVQLLAHLLRLPEQLALHRLDLAAHTWSGCGLGAGGRGRRSGYG